MNPAEPVDVWSVMSPTSYQAAPPRRSIITHNLDLSANAGCRLSLYLPDELQTASCRALILRDFALFCVFQVPA